MNDLMTEMRRCSDVAHEFLNMGCELAIHSTGALPHKSSVWVTNVAGLPDPLPVCNIAIRSQKLIALRVEEDLCRVGFGSLSEMPAFKYLNALGGLKFLLGKETALFVFRLNVGYPHFHQPFENTDRFYSGILAGASTIVNSGVLVHGTVTTKYGLEPVTRYGVLTNITEHPEVESLLVSAQRLHASQLPA